MCQNKFEYFLLEMHNKILHNPKICLELWMQAQHKNITVSAAHHFLHF